MNRVGTQTLETRRLILRRYRLEDAQDMFDNWAHDPEVTRFLTWAPHTDVQATRTLLRGWIEQYGDGGFFHWAIQWKESGRIIGDISVVRLEEATDAAEVGYCLGRAFWGRGIMPEALRAVLDYLFSSAGLNRVTACHDRNNPNSGRVMRKAGMQTEGIRRQAGKNNQGICDLVDYAILKSDREPSPVKTTPASSVLFRLAREEDLPRINELRRQVNDLHTAGEPRIFKPGFPKELRDYLSVIWEDPEQDIVVAQADGVLCGFAVLHHIVRPENPFMYSRDFLDVDEFCVDRAFRRQGVGSGMIRFIRDYARDRGFARVELNMWEFNRSALAFYETAGFVTYRRYMEMK